MKHKKKFFEDISLFCRVIDLDFGDVCPGYRSQGGFSHFDLYALSPGNILQDSPLVQHLPPLADLLYSHTKVTY